ncbi:ALG5 [Candida oxycetoniae]|uniref:dolichyl-phosphate beta-glucosyltransferase n=1 Tax=Candida oxycetoniae TaxID=497107 RepID=A0AAI9WX11_9ASCO|nr:ALG5 [Candida oxycetoniae]KAI3403821.1 ALG5 [Candida oxycetoniae]
MFGESSIPDIFQPIVLCYALGAIIVLSILTYSTVVFFSHTPRLHLPSESIYRTNDGGENLGLERKHSLPPIISPTNASSGNIDISIIIPCYNEVSRLKRMLDEAIVYLEEHHGGKYEIIVVDDGSSDGTSNFAIKVANEYKLKPHVMKVVQLEKNRGKGGAVTHGLLHSQGKYALFADADGATQFSDIKHLINYLKQFSNEPAIAIGSRAHMVNTDAVVNRSLIRNFLMYGLHALVFIFGIRKIQDTQCGFKMFNSQAVAKIFPHMHTERWIFDVEVLLLGELQGIKMKEISVTWKEVDGSKVDLARDSIAMAIDLVVTRLAYLFGVYKIDECGRAGKKQQ